MLTVSDILQDIQRGIFANNMNENKFTYRVVFFINDGNKGTKHYIDTSYENLRRSLENIIKDNLSVTNSIVISAITVRKNKESVSLLSRSYMFSLNDYFRKLNGEYKSRDNYGNTYRKKVCSWC